MILLGYDLGSSSVKASLMDAFTGKWIASAFHPKTEMAINSTMPGFAEQNPESWFENLIEATREVLQTSGVDPHSIKAIGISYQMHGLVLVDKAHKPLRPAIIWCDSRAVSIGEKAFLEIGPGRCLSSLLNSPGNFTAAKLKWVKDHEPDIFEKIHKFMLPGDYIAMRLTGEIATTFSGLSEGIFYDFNNYALSDMVMEYFGFRHELVPTVLPTFSEQGRLSNSAASMLGLTPGIPITYRAGDQPNNAFSLNVLRPGEVAATAGTSGVVYGISDVICYDPESRVNTFAHVNHSAEANRLGVLLCINGTGITNSWLKRIASAGSLSYEQMNAMAAKVAVGSEGISVLPFGNGAERMLGNKAPGCSIEGLDFNRHGTAHLIRAAHEGIAFAFKYGMEIMHLTGIHPEVIRAGDSNMFLSPIFRQTLATISGNTIELYNTDGAQGAARAAGLGAGIYKNFNDAFSGLKVVNTIYPEMDNVEKLSEAYQRWKFALNSKSHQIENN